MRLESTPGVTKRWQSVLGREVMVSGEDGSVEETGDEVLKVWEA